MIYLDNNATTSLDPRVLEVMLPLLKDPGNSSSIHRLGQKARGHLIQATSEVAHHLGGNFSEIVFTSGATEALNMVIFGAVAKKSRGHIVTSCMEHSAVIHPLQKLATKGFEVSYLKPKQGRGALCAEEILSALRPETCLIVLMAANNETGILTDLEKVSAVAETYDIPLIVDGVAWLGKTLLTIPSSVAAFCFSSHKIHGPQGVGGALIRKKYKWEPFILGGPQQMGRRGGTENLTGIVGCARALELIKSEQSFSISNMTRLRNRFEEGILRIFPDAVIHGRDQERICNTSNIAFPAIDGETLLMKLDLAGIAASHGSACSSGTLELSKVLIGMGLSSDLTRSSLRFSVGKFTQEKEIDQALDIIDTQINAIRNLRH